MVQLSRPIVGSVFDNIDTIKSAVAGTHQLAILPKRTVAREVQARTLKMIELEPRLARPVGIIYRRRKTGRGRGAPSAQAAQAFVDHLIAHAGPEAETADTYPEIPSNPRSA